MLSTSATRPTANRFRDFRSIAKTRMIDAGAPELAVNRILGHQDGVAGRYYKLTDSAMREALETLTLDTAAESRTPVGDFADRATAAE